MTEKGATPDQLLAQIASRQHGVATTRQIEVCGIDADGIRWRVAAGRLHRIHRGVYAVGHSAVSFEGRCLAAVIALDPQAIESDRAPKAAVSHRSAAELWGFMQRAIGPIHVSLVGAGGRKQRKGLIIHRSRTLTPELSAFNAGVRVTTPARTLADLRRGLSRELHDRATRKALDLGLISRRDVDSDTALTRSKLEGAFLALCRRHRIPPPAVNAKIGAYEVDFLWRERRLVVETDGYRFHRSRDAFERDRARDADLQARGYTVLRFTHRQLRDSRPTIARRLRALLG